MAYTAQTRILYIKQILETRTDEAHPLSATQIMHILENEYATRTHRTTFYKDIAALKHFGVDIVTVRSKQNLYFVGNRTFEMPELRLMADAICSSRCLTAKKSEELIGKLGTLTSVHLADKLNERVNAAEVPRPQNEQIYYIIDRINHAVDTDKKIRFTYTEYSPDKERVLRGDGEIYTLSPYSCVWSGDYYYVVGWCDKHDDVSTFRIDRIAGTPDIAEETRVPAPEGFDIAAYSKSVFHMFQGETATVKLLCENSTMKAVIDRFSEDVHTTVHDDDHFIATVTVALSPTFYGWVFEFGGNIRILSPDNAIHDMRRMLDAFTE